MNNSKFIFIAFLFILFFSCSKKTTQSNQNTKDHHIQKESNTTHYLITATSSQKAVDEGMRILKNGGSAMDAVLSASLAEIAETEGKFISYAGFMNLLYYEAETGNVYNMNAAFNTIQEESEPLTIPKANYGSTVSKSKTVLNGRTILVPGFMKGVEEAHEKFGKIPFHNLFDNAISMAEKGVIWSSLDDRKFRLNENIMTHFSETKRIFTKPDGTYYQVGDTFRQPELAKTLKKISIEGSDYMYKGEWGNKFVQKARQVGSKITLQDLADYDVIWTKPIHKKYNGYDVYVNGEPSYGGVTLVEALNFTEISGFSKMRHYSKSDTALATLYQISNLSNRLTYYPLNVSTELDLSNKSRLEMNTSKEVWKLFYQSKSNSKGNVKIYKNEHSAAVVAIDKFGNMATVIHTINTLDWGSTGIFIDGISIPDAACFQQDLINKAGQGKRLPEGTTPGIVLKDGKPILGFSCIGSGLQNQTFVNLISILDFRISPIEVVNTPGIGVLNYSNGYFNLFIAPNQFSDSLIIKASKLGGHFIEDKSVINGFWTGIYREKDGNLIGTSVWHK